MKPKTVKSLYWITVLLFALLMTLDGIGGLMGSEAGREAMKMLGYPYYIMTIVGAAKLLGVVGILQTRSRTVREWAYAGFTFNFVCAGISILLSGMPAFGVIFPLVAILLMALPYWFWKRSERLEAAGSVALA